jgi:hypothetical protein
MLDSVESIVVVGCGGIGSWLIPPLARYLTAENFSGRLALWDGDKYSSDNARRQDFPIEFTNRNKAEASLLNLNRMLPDGHPSLLACDQYVTPETISRCVTENSCIITCVDNHPARALINKAAMDKANVTVISAGNEKLDGNAHVYIRRQKRDITTNLFDRHPEIETAKKGERKPGCIEEISNGETQLLVTNYAAAHCALIAFFSIWNYGKRFGKARMLTLPQEIYFDIGAMKVVPVLKGE